jgi:glucan phosphoethanolaminetransferase (alkaline phosphatase superfamily)
MEKRPRISGDRRFAKGEFRGYIVIEMSQIMLLTGNFFILIISLVGVQTCYFKSRWKWFCLMLICVLLSSMCIGVVVYQWMMPPEHDPVLLNRLPVAPL